MVELLHIGFKALIVFSSLALSFYSFRLFNKFFKGGIFGSSFLIFGFAAFLLAVAFAFDTVLDWVGISTAETEFICCAFNFSFVIALSYGIYQLYKAWTKLGSR